MDHGYIEEHQVVDRYLMGRLGAEDEARFEEHYLHCRECLDRLELAERFQRGLKRATAEDVARVAASRQLAVLAWLGRLGRGGQTAFLTAFLLAALVPAGLMIRERGQTSSALEALRAPQPNTAVLALGPERGLPQPGLEPSHRIRLTGTPEWIVLSLGLDDPGHERYRVTLLRGETEVWRGDGLEPDHLDALVLSLHSSWLEAGDYVARAEALPAAGPPLPAAHFSFRVITAD